MGSEGMFARAVDRAQHHVLGRGRVGRGPSAGQTLGPTAGTVQGPSTGPEYRTPPYYRQLTDFDFVVVAPRESRTIAVSSCGTLKSTEVMVSSSRTSSTSHRELTMSLSLSDLLATSVTVLGHATEDGTSMVTDGGSPSQPVAENPIHATMSVTPAPHGAMNDNPEPPSP